MVTRVGESVAVVAVFGRGGTDNTNYLGLRPVKFSWRKRVISIKEVTFSWRTTSGSSTMIHFSVTDGATLFELVYCQSDMSWSLENIRAG